MAQNQTNFKLNIKVGELTKVHQEILQKYYPVVKKVFSVMPTNTITLEESADQEYKKDLLNFLRTIEAVFGETQPSIKLSQLAIGKDILIMSVKRCWFIYRKQFRGFSYLTVAKLESTHKMVEKEAMLIFTQKTIKENERALLKEHIPPVLKKLRIWIDEVNTFKKNNVLTEIKAEIFENLQGLVQEKLSNLCEETQDLFYEEPVLSQRIAEIFAIAYDSFRNEIPFQEDENSAAKIYEDFHLEVDNFLKVYIIKNERNKQAAKEKMLSAFDLSVGKYEEAIRTVLNEEPMAEPFHIQMQHTTIQELHLPILTNLVTISDNWRSKCMSNYATKTDKVFQELLLEYNQKTNQALKKCYHDVTEIVNQQIATVFSTHKIPNAYIGRAQQSFNDQMENILKDIKDSTIANPDVVENLSLTSKPGTSKDAIGAVKTSGWMTGAKVGINIRLLDGQTYKVDAYSFWTVEKLKDTLAKNLKRSDSSFTICHKTKKLQDTSTIESYNIQEGDFLIANI